MSYAVNSPKTRQGKEQGEEAIASGRRLWELSFSDEEAFLDLYFGSLVAEHEIYLLDEEQGSAVGHIHADQYALHLYPHEGSRGQGTATYISGACTHPEHRGRGVMQQLMQAVLREEAERGHLLCTLIPADQDLRTYYHRHFGFVTHSYAYTTESEALAIRATYRQGGDSTRKERTPTDALYWGERGANIVGVWHSRADWAGIIAQYQQAEHTWLRIATSAGEQSSVRALALGRCEAEAIYIDALVGSDADKAELIETIRREARQKPLIFALPQWAEGDVRRAPRGMVRPLNIPALMALYARVHPSEAHSFSLSDEIIPCNTGHYEVKDGRCVFTASEIQTERLISLGTLVDRFVPELSMPLMND